MVNYTRNTKHLMAQNTPETNTLVTIYEILSHATASFCPFHNSKRVDLRILVLEIIFYKSSSVITKRFLFGGEIQLHRE